MVAVGQNAIGIVAAGLYNSFGIAALSLLNAMGLGSFGPINSMGSRLPSVGSTPWVWWPLAA